MNKHPNEHQGACRKRWFQANFTALPKCKHSGLKVTSQQQIIPTEKQGSCCIMLWGCISQQKRKNLYRKLKKIWIMFNKRLLWRKQKSRTMILQTWRATIERFRFRQIKEIEYSAFKQKNLEEYESRLKLRCCGNILKRLLTLKTLI